MKTWPGNIYVLSLQLLHSPPWGNKVQLLVIPKVILSQLTLKAH